jgi:hypothetical protein
MISAITPTLSCDYEREIGDGRCRIVNLAETVTSLRSVLRLG